MTDIRAEQRVTQQVGSNVIDLLVACNSDPIDYYSQTNDKYLNNRPIVKGEFNGHKLAHFSKWFNFITGATFYYNEVDNASECGWYDEEGLKNV